VRDWQPSYLALHATGELEDRVRRALALLGETRCASRLRACERPPRWGWALAAARACRWMVRMSVDSLRRHGMIGIAFALLSRLVLVGFALVGPVAAGAVLSEGSAPEGRRWVAAPSDACAP
jgi:hypothetical protein